MVKRYLLILLAAIALISTIVIAACTPKTEMPPAEESSQLFFEPLTYTNDEYGFSIKYPDTYKEVKSEEKGDVLFYAAGPLGNKIPVLFIKKMDPEETAQQKLKYLEDFTLADGKTTGKLYLYTWSIGETTPMRNLELVVVKGDYAISSTIMATELMYNKKRYLDIFRTFNLN